MNTAHTLTLLTHLLDLRLEAQHCENECFYVLCAQFLRYQGIEMCTETGIDHHMMRPK